MKFVLPILALFLVVASSAQTPPSTGKQKTSFASVREILTAYPNSKDPATRLQNNCHFILQGGAYVISQRGKAQDIALLLKHLPRIDIEDSIVTTFMNQHGAARFTDYYYMLQALKKGEEFDAARDGISMSTLFPSRPLNRNDYAKLKDIFSHHNTLLHDTYLEKMKFLFQNNGCPKEIAELQALIESHVADSPLKQEILKLYAQYAPLGEGKPAPLSPLQDVNGKNYTFADFKGKVIIVDIWATWCCNCIEKMPKFMQLKDEFQDNNNILFLSLSIDRKSAHGKWLKAIQENHMGEMLNLITAPSENSNFEKEYLVVGVPRYIIIDREGMIVTTFAPGPGPEMKALILNTLKQ